MMPQILRLVIAFRRQQLNAMVGGEVVQMIGVVVGIRQQVAFNVGTRDQLAGDAAFIDLLGMTSPARMPPFSA